MSEIDMRLRATVGPRGQVVIPKEIRELLGIKPGSEVVFELEGDVVELRVSKRTSLEEFLDSVPRERKLKRRVDLKKLILEEVEER